jgi:histidinol-phosphate aminotransferase
MNLPKAKKIDIQKYEGGLSKLANITDAIKLSANESALGCSPNAKKAFYDCQSIISKYPDTSSQALKNNLI